MYAGTGRITGLAGRDRWSIATSRPWMTSGSGSTHSGATAQPNASAWYVAHASCIARMIGCGR